MTLPNRNCKICCAVLLYCLASVASAETAPPYTEVFYKSGDLRIQAYVYKPAGDGPFPVVIYNHGSRDGRERTPTPFQYIGNMLTRAGYAVLVPERRGYGKSDGKIWWQETGNDPAHIVARLQAETDDVLAAREYLRGLSFVDANRVGVMGWSFGGVVTMLAVSRSREFRAAVNQAGGALSWDGNPELRRALVAAAEKTTTPTLLMVAKNDRTTSSITTLADVLEKRGVTHRAIVYEPYTPPPGARVAAPGHALFAARGANLWERDLLQFLERHLGTRAANADRSDRARPAQ